MGGALQPSIRQEKTFIYLSTYPMALTMLSIGDVAEQPSSNNDNEATIQYTSSYLSNYRNVTARVGKDQQEEEISTEDLGKVLSSDFLDSITPDASSKQTLAKMLKKSRSYNLDLTPKLLSCKSELVEVLIRSGVGRYLEFKGVDELCLFQNGKLERVGNTHTHTHAHTYDTII